MDCMLQNKPYIMVTLPTQMQVIRISFFLKLFKVQILITSLPRCISRYIFPLLYRSLLKMLIGIGDDHNLFIIEGHCNFHFTGRYHNPKPAES